MVRINGQRNALASRNRSMRAFAPRLQYMILPQQNMLAFLPRKRTRSDADQWTNTKHGLNVHIEAKVVGGHLADGQAPKPEEIPQENGAMVSGRGCAFVCG